MMTRDPNMKSMISNTSFEADMHSNIINKSQISEKSLLIDQLLEVQFEQTLLTKEVK